jgi:hypothetical protein
MGSGFWDGLDLRQRCVRDGTRLNQMLVLRILDGPAEALVPASGAMQQTALVRDDLSIVDKVATATPA